MIQIQELTKVYQQGGRQIVALDRVSLHVKPGEIFGVLGPSGAGKSTLIRCVNLLERPTSGSIKVAGQEMTALSPQELRQKRQQIGMIFQHFNLLSSRTAKENVALPLEVMGKPKAEIEAKALELLRLVGLEDRADAYPAQLSGGQKQRVGIARALAGDPQVLLSDEATSALDPDTTRGILDLLRDLNRRLGLTVLLITHQMEVVKRICDSVAVVSDGRIVEQGPLLEVVKQPGSSLAQEFFGHLPAHEAQPGRLLATLTFIGEVADQPILTRLARKHGLDLNILGGTVEQVGGGRVGRLQVEFFGELANLGPALADLTAQGLQVEVSSR